MWDETIIYQGAMYIRASMNIGGHLHSASANWAISPSYKVPTMTTTHTSTIELTAMFIQVWRLHGVVVAVKSEHINYF